MRFIPEIPHLPGTKERKKALGRRHYQQHKESLRERSRQYRATNPEILAERGRRYHNSISGRARNLFNSAKNRSCGEFSITLEWLTEKLTKGYCELSGVPFKFTTDGTRSRDPYGPSIDRIDSSKGYVEGNCRVILWALNMAFCNWGESVYREIAESYLRNRTPLEYDL